MTASYPKLAGKSLFLGVGAQKSGTTWVSNYLAGHPDVFMSPLKEMHFWGNRTSTAKWPNSAFQRRLNRLQTDAHPDARTNALKDALRDRLVMGGNIEEYAQYFNKRVSIQHTYGEISPAYCKLSADEFERIKSYFPNTKIIFLLRNPADRLWSQIRFSEKVETLEEMELLIDGTFEKKVYLDRMNYVRTLQTITDCFEPENTHFQFFESLFTHAAVSRLCRFLGVDNHAAEFTKKRNVSVKMPLRPDLREGMVEKLSEQYTFVRDFFGGDIPPSWAEDLHRLDASR